VAAKAGGVYLLYVVDFKQCHKAAPFLKCFYFNAL
jgi:hypothetical protein